MSSEQRSRPIVVVTGANGGVGFAVCQRLLSQLARSNPPDARPQPDVSRRICVENVSQGKFDFGRCDGLTLVMACRNLEKAKAAKIELLRSLDENVQKLKIGKDYDGHAETLKNNVKIDIVRLDLASMKSVFRCSEELNAKYPYISHLICNAGVASFYGYDWFLLIKQFLRTGPAYTFTHPAFKLQRKGEKSEDGLGWVWQCNVFGHYALFRLLRPVLERYFTVSASPARAIWMSSVEALPSAYDPRDWQLIDSERSYEASKYQMDLLVGHFEAEQHKSIESDANGHANGIANGSAQSSDHNPPIRHFLAHPGVVVTSFASASLNNSVFLETSMQIVFYITHLLGSVNHVLTPYRAAVSAVHLILVALPFITVAVSKKDSSSSSHEGPAPLKFASKVRVWGREYVDAEEILEWDEHRELATELARKCDDLYRTFAEVENSQASTVSRG